MYEEICSLVPISCIGMKFASIEGSMIHAGIVRHVKVEIGPGDDGKELDLFNMGDHETFQTY